MSKIKDWSILKKTLVFGGISLLVIAIVGIIVYIIFGSKSSTATTENKSETNYTESNQSENKQ